jgi:hypothetical protein
MWEAEGDDLFEQKCSVCGAHPFAAGPVLDETQRERLRERFRQIFARQEESDGVDHKKG